MEELYTLKEIAGRLGVPESNLRYYRNRIGDLLPAVGKGRRRRYLPEAETIFRRTVEMVQEGVSLDRVYKHLASEKPLEAEIQSAISQEDLIGRLSEKIAEKIKESNIQSGQSGNTADLKQQFEQLAVKMAVLLDKRADHAGPATESGDLEKKIDRQAAELRRLSGLMEELGHLVGVLREEIDEYKKEIGALREEIKAKEGIIEHQKEQLLDARSKRLNIEKELAGIRALIEKAAAGGR